MATVAVAVATSANIQWNVVPAPPECASAGEIAGLVTILVPLPIETTLVVAEIFPLLLAIAIKSPTTKLVRKLVPVPDIVLALVMSAMELKSCFTVPGRLAVVAVASATTI